jgi:polar amino acid transport system substrate-binding protein
MTVCVLTLVLGAGSAFAADYTAVVIQLPVSDAYVTLFNAIGEVTGNTFTTQVVPPARAAALIESQKVDVKFPATKSTDPQKNTTRKYDLSSVKVFSMVFVLYANKDKYIDAAQLKKGNPQGLGVETTASLAGLFEFKPVVAPNVETSLKKVDAGRADGLIYPQEAGDPQVKSLGLKKISRSMYSLNDITFGLQKGQSGGPLDKIMVDGIAKLKANGRLDKIIAFALKNGVYDDWQP